MHDLLKPMCKLHLSYYRELMRQEINMNFKISVQRKR